MGRTVRLTLRADQRLGACEPGRVRRRGPGESQAVRQTAWITIDSSLHSPGDQLACLHHGESGAHPGLPLEARNGLAVALTVPAGGFVVYG
jgi:hypothetical protein